MDEMMFEKDRKEQKEQIMQIPMRRACTQRRRNRWKGLAARHTWSIRGTSRGSVWLKLSEDNGGRDECPKAVEAR